MLSESRVQHYADELFGCMTGRRMVEPLTDREPEITVADGYAIARRFLEKRMATQGEKVIGKKIGATSAAVQEMLGVYEPDFGFLTDAMLAPEGQVPIGGLIQPRAEAEIAFRLSSDLAGPGITASDVLAATEVVMPCFEIVDSRIEGWRIRIQDTIADNASCGLFVIGAQAVSPAGLDLAACKVTVTKNGQYLSEGLGSAVQGSPLEAVAWLANTFGELGQKLEAGEIVLSGSLVPLEPVVPGDTMSMDIPGLGSTHVEFTE